MRCTALLIAMMFGFAGLGGCAKFEYEITRPPDLVRHVTAADWVSVREGTLEYRFITAEDRLVLHVFNPTPDAVQLVGEKSVVVDPAGQSHPLKSQLIAPKSFVKLILPPMPTRLEPSGPRIGFGIGVGYGSAFHRGRGGYGYGPAWDDAYGYDEPRYYSVYDPNDTTYWEWTGDGDARLTLTFESAGKTFSQQFTVRRMKV